MIYYRKYSGKSLSEKLDNNCQSESAALHSRRAGGLLLFWKKTIDTLSSLQSLIQLKITEFLSVLHGT